MNVFKQLRILLHLIRYRHETPAQYASRRAQDMPCPVQYDTELTRTYSDYGRGQR